jgi:mono/diheme cytochrome c family protein
MSRRVCLMLGLAFALASVIAVRQTSAAPSGPQVQNPNGWTLPADADTTKNPLTVDAKVLAAGKAVYKDKCQRCHGPAGLGDGEDADPDVADDMNLTNPKRADRNSDGIVFYKVFNGRKKPKMPAFKDDLTKDQIWQVVSYVQTLRKKP